MSNVRFIAPAFAFLWISLTGCLFEEDPAPNRGSNEPVYEIIPVAGVTTKTLRSNDLAWTIDDPADSIVQDFRIPRSRAEFLAQIAAGLWTSAPDSNGKMIHTGVQYVKNSGTSDAKCWTPFLQDVIKYTQTNGFPDELVFALKAPNIKEISVEYKVNYSGWTKLKLGRDYGVLGGDSIRLTPALASPLLKSHHSLIGINLKILGKNFLSEGANTVSIRILQNGKPQHEKTISLHYVLVGVGVEESDSVGSPASKANKVFYRDSAWGSVEQKRTFVFLSTRYRLDSLDVRIQSDFSDTSRAYGVDSNLYKLPMGFSTGNPEGDGWSARRTEFGTLLELRISKSQFIKSELPNQNYRYVIIHGRMVLTPGFPPDNTSFKVRLPLSL